MSKRKFSGNISGKGYYIALILCAVAIGITGYLYYRNANNNQTNGQDAAAVISDAEKDQDVQAVATQPGQDATAPSPDGESNQSVPTKPGKTVAPVAGSEVAPYAVDALAYNQTTRDWRVHDGVDIAAEAGTPVMAAAAGTVYSVYEDETMGTTVVITHAGGYATKYASLGDNVAVEPGDTVEAGQTIGCVGSSALLESAIGDHVHFSVSCQGQSVDPAEFLAEASA